MEQIINLQIQKLSEGRYPAASGEVPGLAAQGRAVAETPDVTRGMSRKLLEARAERHGVPMLRETGDSFDYPLVVGAT